MSTFRVDTIPDDPKSRYTLGKCIGTGICGTVFEAADTKNGNRKVAIKIQRYTPETEQFIQEEYRILKDFSEHPNLPDFYGIYKNKEKNNTEIWFVMELCEGGSVMDLVRSMYAKNRRLAEEHIAFILQETTKALVHLHQNHIIHRDICGNNILLTKEGEIKLVDFGLAREIKSTLGKRSTCIGSACWMAPEVVTSSHKTSDSMYGARADVWALGITAIELADGKPPFHGMHPTRTMFQIVRNPPPGLYRPSNWSNEFNDFIAECLEKNPDYRPFIIEIVEHPFLTSIPENNYYLTQELKKLSSEIREEDKGKAEPESTVKCNLVKTSQDAQPEQMYVEDLAAIENANEDQLVAELKGRISLGYFQTFIGDVLLIINPNETQDIYNKDYHEKYKKKSQSENPPHIFSIADRAYQDVLHHELPQYILLSGESGSGKTTAMRNLIDHLCYIGDSKTIIGNAIEQAVEIIHALTNASTPTNHDSTRCFMKTQLCFGSTGKSTGAVFGIYQLEKWRVSCTDLSQANFHILYYFYDAMHSSGQLNMYLLDSHRNYRYLRLPEHSPNPKEIRNNPRSNIDKFNSIVEALKSFNFTTEQIETFHRTLSAILNLGDICFKETYDKNEAEIENPEVCNRVAELLKVDEKKFVWALTNYCLVNMGTAVRRRNTSNQARDARDMLANCLYARMVDWIVSGINNNKMAHSRAIFGEKYLISIYDHYGFECFKRNDLEQLLVNALNEQMQYHYIQRVFAWELMEQKEDGLPPTVLNYYDNKKAVDHLLGKSVGVLSLIDEASKTGHSFEHVLDSIERSKKNPFLKSSSDREFFFSHFTGTVIYDIREMIQKNRDFLPPEMIETLRMSKCPNISQFFTNKLTKSGTLYFSSEIKESDKKWSSGLVAEQAKRGFTEQPQFSQTKHMRTAIATFRSICLDILRELSVGAGAGGTHFIRCIRSDLKGKPRGFHDDLVRQQLRALSIPDTARARQLGYPHRITFPEFLKRYKFLAFDFDENVDITKDNCRLLLVRLKMEGWVIGKTKVFLKYYNEEYLSRLYETQVTKIIKIQAMMRSFLAKRKIQTKLQKMQRRRESRTLIRQASADLQAEAAAAILIQRVYRGHVTRRDVGPMINSESGQIDKDTVTFIRPFFKKWKNKSIFQVLLKYRSAKFQELVNLSQQIHIFNQNAIHALTKFSEDIELQRVDPCAKADAWLGEKIPTVWKLPFRFDEIPFYDTEHLCENSATTDDDIDNWDSPLKWRQSRMNEARYCDSYQRSPTPLSSGYIDQTLIGMPYCRDGTMPSPSATPGSNPIGRIKSPVSPVVISPQSFRSPPNTFGGDRNFEGANQDFEFIRTPKAVNKLKRSPGNPIAELESLGRKEKNSDDDPPFNFQGMLRKTNIQRQSLKRAVENMNDRPEMSFGIGNFQMNNTRKEPMRRKFNGRDFLEEEDLSSTELAPGIILEGKVAEL